MTKKCVRESRFVGTPPRPPEVRSLQSAEIQATGDTGRLWIAEPVDVPWSGGSIS
jgi:hypothetical protein